MENVVIEAKSKFDVAQNCAYGTFVGPFVNRNQQKFIDNAKNLLNILRVNHLHKQINNISKMGVLDIKVKNYLQNEWFPEAKKAGLTHFAFVVPEDQHAKISMDLANKNVYAKFGIEVKYFTTDIQARNWLNTIK
jgi:hypothetical protein